MKPKTKMLTANFSKGELIDDVVNTYLNENEKIKPKSIVYQTVVKGEEIIHFAFLTYNDKKEESDTSGIGFK